MTALARAHMVPVTNADGTAKRTVPGTSMCAGLSDGRRFPEGAATRRVPWQTGVSVMPTESSTPAQANPPGQPWQEHGFHWHVYQLLAPKAGLPCSADRDERLGTRPNAARRTPHDVAEWLARVAERHGGSVFVWIAEEDSWRCLGDIDAEFEHVRVELTLLAASGESVYVMISDGTVRQDLFAEAVTAAECADSLGHHPTAATDQTRAEL
jgi:hypothetical protein